jgi:hypothetical protein
MLQSQHQLSKSDMQGSSGNLPRHYIDICVGGLRKRVKYIG